MPHLSIRHQSRMVILQSLYEWDFDEEKDTIEVLKRNIKNSGFKVDEEFCIKIVEGVTRDIKKINNTIKETAPDWPIDQIASIDRAILRLGIFELIYDDEVPPKAVINEAVELGKEFGGENSGKFINGVLGTIYRSSKRYEEEDIVVNAGGIIYRMEEGEPKFLLLKNIYEKWGFPKGKVEEGETWQEAAVREIAEETGIEEAKIELELGEIRFTDKSTGKATKKSVHFYLVKTSQKDVKVGKSEGIIDLKWVDEKEVAEMLGYPNLIDVFKKAVEEIGKK